MPVINQLKSAIAVITIRIRYFFPISNYIFIVILRTTYVAHFDNKKSLNKLDLNLIHKIVNYKTNILLYEPLMPGLFMIITIDNYSEKYVAENKWPHRNLWIFYDCTWIHHGTSGKQLWEIWYCIPKMTLLRNYFRHHFQFNSIWNTIFKPQAALLMYINTNAINLLLTLSYPIVTFLHMYRMYLYPPSM